MLQETTTIWATIKANFAKYLSMAVAFLSPIHGIILLILLAVGIDTYFGRRAARVKARNEGKDERLEVTSKKTRSGFTSKITIYLTLLIATLYLDKILLNDLLLYFIPGFPIHFLITKGLGIIFLAIELDSIDESYYKIKGVRIKEMIRDKVRAIKKMILGAKTFKDEIEE